MADCLIVYWFGVAGGFGLFLLVSAIGPFDPPELTEEEDATAQQEFDRRFGEGV